MKDRQNNLRKPPELFAERPVTSDFARAKSGSSTPSYMVRRFITLFVVFTLIGGGLFWKFSGPARVVPPEEIPTIKADGSYKQRPEQPGGIDIPHQDVQVYQSLDSKGAPKDQVEHLLPPPETPEASAVTKSLPPRPTQAATTTEIIDGPIPKPAAVSTTVTQVAPVPVAAPAAAVTAAPVAATVVKPAPAAVAPVTATKAVPKSLDQIIQKVTAANTAAAPVAATNAAPTPAGHSAVQLAALPDQTAAQTLMKKLQTQHAGILGSTQLRVVKADLGAKGIYYRIQSQPTTEDRAKSLCAALKSANAGCILVRP